MWTRFVLVGKEALESLVTLRYTAYITREGRASLCINLSVVQSVRLCVCLFVYLLSSQSLRLVLVEKEALESSIALMVTRNGSSLSPMNQPIFHSVFLAVCLPSSLSVSFFVRMCVCLWICCSVWLSLRISVCLSLCLSVCLFVKVEVRSVHFITICDNGSLWLSTLSLLPCSVLLNVYTSVCLFLCPCLWGWPEKE